VKQQVEQYEWTSCWHLEERLGNKVGLNSDRCCWHCGNSQLQTWTAADTFSNPPSQCTKEWSKQKQCPKQWQPGWAAIRRNIHPLSPTSYYNMQCIMSAYVTTIASSLVFDTIGWCTYSLGKFGYTFGQQISTWQQVKLLRNFNYMQITKNSSNLAVNYVTFVSEHGKLIGNPDRCH